MEKASPNHARFGDCELDLSLGRLSRDGQSVQLGEKPLRVLVTLIEQAGQLVTRENLQRKLWPNDTIVDFEHGINTAIAVLRRALGESAEAPKYIETIPRRGYRLLVPVAWITTAKDSEGARRLPHPFVTAPRLTGLRVSHFRVLEVIGGGGMGVVYRGEDLPLGRSVALKFLSEELAGNSEALDRFRLEARAVSMLDHPNICPIYEFGEHEDQPFFVMPLLQGRILRDRLSDAASRNQPIPLKELLEIGLEVLSGLQAAHEKGIIHRDIKPANIFLTEYGQAKIMDFGLAKLATSISSSSPASAETNMPFPVRDLRLTNPGRALGTLAYMSPEQARSEELDARTDLFSFGTVLYEMATGTPAFHSEDPALVLKAILEENPPPATTLNPALPMELDRILANALEKDRNVRYQSAAEMRADLQQLKRETEYRLLAQVPTPDIDLAKRGHRPSPELQNRESARVGREWRMLALISGGMAALLLLLLGLYVSSRDRLFRKNADLQIHSIAVLPLQNLSGDLSQEYFSDGMTDALITDLAQIGSVKVISRTSSMQYKQTKKKLSEIAHELGVDGIIEGSTQRSGDRVRITAQLIHAPSDGHLWANTYEGDFRNLFTLERNVTEDIARQVQTRLMPRDQIAATQPRLTNPKALDAYLQGNYHLQRYTRSGGVEEMKKASDLFQQAIDADPKFAPAYFGLAQAHDEDALVLPEDAAIVRKARETALALDPNSPEAQIAVANDKWAHFDWSGAEKELRRAVMLNPNNAPAHDDFCELLAQMGRLDEALKECQIAQELDPDNDHLATVLYQRGEYDRAISILRLMIERNSDDGNLHYTLFECYVMSKNDEEAVPELERFLTLGGFSDVAARIHQVFVTSGFRAAMFQWAKEIEKAQAMKQAYFPVNLADAYAVLGENDRAFYWLSDAIAHRDLIAGGLPATWLGTDPMLESLRSDPRFEDLKRRIGLPP